MIQASELRIGNWVHPIFPLKVVRITSTDIYCDFDGNEGDVWEFTPKDLDPIPLTPELLEKAGFKKSITNTCYGIITESGEDRISIFADGRMKLHATDLSVKVNYVHQLQNLFWCLTGKELNIKL